MENYIINPNVFYWINVFSILQTVFAVVGVTSILCGIGYTIYHIYLSSNINIPSKPDEKDDWGLRRYNEDKVRYDRDIEIIRKMRKNSTIFFVVGVLCVVLAIFTPSKTASVEMLVAKTATFDNFDWSMQQVKELIDYITSALKGVV